MRAFIPAVVALGACVAIGASAGAVAAKPAKSTTGRCFHADSVRDFQAFDEKTVYFRADNKRTYAMEVFGSCPNVDDRLSIGLKSRNAGWICDANDIELIVPNVVGPGRCYAKSLRLLSPDEVEALKHRKR